MIHIRMLYAICIAHKSATAMEIPAFLHFRCQDRQHAEISLLGDASVGAEYVTFCGAGHGELITGIWMGL